MARSQNGWPAIAAYGDNQLHQWVVPASTGAFKMLLRHGSAGFVLCHFLLWYAEVIEPVIGKVLDDWGYAPRPVRGSSTTLSNHASGTAADVNALAHPLGKRGTFRRRVLFRGRRVWVKTAIIARLRTGLYGGTIRWGGEYHGRADEMHYELVKPLTAVERVARRLASTPRGKRILKANPTQAAVIWS